MTGDEIGRGPKVDEGRETTVEHTVRRDQGGHRACGEAVLHGRQGGGHRLRELHRGRHAAAEAEGRGGTRRSGRPPRQTYGPQVRLVGRHSHEQKGAVMTGDSATTVGVQRRPRGQDVPLLVVLDRADRLPGAGQPGELAATDEVRDVATGESGVPQISQVDDAVLVGGVHPVHDGQRDGVASVPGRRRAGLWTTGSAPRLRSTASRAP